MKDGEGTCMELGYVTNWVNRGGVACVSPCGRDVDVGAWLMVGLGIIFVTTCVGGGGACADYYHFLAACEEVGGGCAPITEKGVVWFVFGLWKLLCQAVRDVG